MRRLKQAGAIPIGKTNCPEFLGNYESDNNIIGRTNNPWNLERTAGGSSGGESAAIAALFSAGGIGSDGGGSVRVPAHFCGIAGLKPTPGRVSAAGHVPDICHPGGLLGVAGPMARTAQDVKLLFEVLAGYDSQDPFSAPVPLRTPELKGLTIGVTEQFYDTPVQAAVRAAVKRAAGCARDLGFAVEDYAWSGLERAPNLWWFFFGQLPARITKELLSGREEQAHWTGTEFLYKALQETEPTAKKVVENLAVRDKMRSAMLRDMERVSVLLLPVCGVSAFEHRRRKYDTDGKAIGLFEAMMPSTVFNFLGFPGMTIPFGVDGAGSAGGCATGRAAVRGRGVAGIGHPAGGGARAVPGTPGVYRLTRPRYPNCSKCRCSRYTKDGVHPHCLSGVSCASAPIFSCCPCSKAARRRRWSAAKP